MKTSGQGAQRPAGLNDFLFPTDDPENTSRQTGSRLNKKRSISGLKRNPLYIPFLSARFYFREVMLRYEFKHKVTGSGILSSFASAGLPSTSSTVFQLKSIAPNTASKVSSFICSSTSASVSSSPVSTRIASSHRLSTASINLSAYFWLSPYPSASAP